MLDLIVRSLPGHHASSAPHPHNLRPSQPVNHIALGLTICTMFLYLVASSLVAYALLQVVGTLVIVEEMPSADEAGADPDHSPDAVANTDANADVDEPLLDPALPAPRWRMSMIATSSSASGTVTAGVRKTIRYLRAEAGRFSMFRGLGYYVGYYFLEGLINGVAASSLKNLLPASVVYAVCAVLPILTQVLLLWRFNNAWLHKVVSKPSRKSWYMRVREQKGSMAVKKAIFLWACCRSISSSPWLLLYLAAQRKFEAVDGEIHFQGPVALTVLECLGIFALVLVLRLLLVVPATAVLVRVQASMLPADDQGIVPVDRALCKSVALESEDGNATLEPMVGGTGLTLLGVWRSFVWPARISLLKVYVKCYMVQIAMTILCAVVVIMINLIFKPPYAVVARTI